jgi:deoxyhypusine synthase
MTAQPTEDGGRNRVAFSDGVSDGLKPLHPLDLSKVRGFGDLLEQMRHTAFAGRQIGEAADILYTMASDKDCMVVGTFSGAMTMAQQGLLLTDMIEQGLLDAVICTGAMLSHGLVLERGGQHFRCPADFDDREFFTKGIDRVYDTLELEINLDGNQALINQAVFPREEGYVFCSHDLLGRIGALLNEKKAGRGILQAAARRNVPVFVPAFTDCELGMSFALTRLFPECPKGIGFDPFLDMDRFTELICEAKELGIFTIGGGVPRNWAQQVAPYAEYRRYMKTGRSAPPPRYRYCVRVCPEPAHWGGLSGCTYKEGVSWGKFVPEAEGGRFAEVHVDATVGWPMILAAVFERMGTFKH